jgi:succinate dehydrogenase / fumarate reductase iron-sulfur subunit
MASSNKSTDVVIRSKARSVAEGRLPLTEILFDRAGAASPFGDDQLFPLPISELTYVHPTADAPPAHL